MEKFIGTKIIKAEKEPITWYDHYKNQGWEWPKDKKEGNRMGYTVGYSDAKGNFDGPLQEGCHYISWSPYDVFEAAYAQKDNLTFGIALECAKWGDKIVRKGWNGKGIFVALGHGTEGQEMSGDFLYIDTTGLQTDNPDAPKTRVPWAPSQTDMLANDWEIL